VNSEGLEKVFKDYHATPQQARAKEGPLSEKNLEELTSKARNLVASAIPEWYWCRKDSYEKTEVPPGQPFALYLMHALANMAGDPDCEYPLQVIHGVPLGVDEDVLDDPEIWPTKEELGLEPPELEPACVRAAENYGSANLFCM
jgi:hypothetical protein